MILQIDRTEDRLWEQERRSSESLIIFEFNPARIWNKKKNESWSWNDVEIKVKHEILSEFEVTSSSEFPSSFPS